MNGNFNLPNDCRRLYDCRLGNQSLTPERVTEIETLIYEELDAPFYLPDLDFSADKDWPFHQLHEDF